MFVALKRQLFGDTYLGVGDEVPVEEGRNYNLMLRQGLIADLDQQAKTEGDAAAASKAAKARIDSLEKDLAAANAESERLRGELVDVRGELERAHATIDAREGNTPEGDATHPEKVEPEHGEPGATAVLDSLSKADLLELAEKQGVEVRARASKGAIVELLSADAASKE
jgi:hypothetical protein